jgi:hypothetical protein
MELPMPTFASRPGRVALNPIHWALHYPLVPVSGIILIGIVISGVQLRFLPPGVIVVALFLCVAYVLYWYRVFAHFWHGDANPGIIVSTNPTLVAVSTDMRTGYGEYPAVKIIRAPTRDVEGRQYEVGDHLPTVALYSGSQTNSHWDNFDPRPAQAATSSRRAIRKLLNRFAEEDWARLESYLRSIPQPYRTGLYWIKTRDELQRKKKRRRPAD